MMKPKEEIPKKTKYVPVVNTIVSDAIASLPQQPPVEKKKIEVSIPKILPPKQEKIRILNIYSTAVSIPVEDRKWQRLGRGDYIDLLPETTKNSRIQGFIRRGILKTIEIT